METMKVTDVEGSGNEEGSNAECINLEVYPDRRVSN